ncbi:hypothetical protein SASPL_108164 [Salvia splendens]|uniref:Peptidoglycan binding-like domain-containing protein n=1 Tax=Salvia splendens TaxID=180675 RepID=A0A8X8YCL4_SALSN|nr:hypothetical protein SASPL_108164 [Salvia splendens]
MAPKLLNILSIVFLVVVILLCHCSGSKGNKTAGFELVKLPATKTTQFDLEVHLREYGHYQCAQLILAHEDLIPESPSEHQILELAIKLYQAKFGIKPTGQLDDQTLSAILATT